MGLMTRWDGGHRQVHIQLGVECIEAPSTTRALACAITELWFDAARVHGLIRLAA